MSELRVTTLQHEAAAASNITLAANGNVGIGTSSPASALSFGAVVGKTLAVFENAGGNNIYGIGMTGVGTVSDPFRTRLFSNGFEYLSIDYAGRVTMPFQPAASVSYAGADLNATSITPLNTGAITRGGIAIGTNAFTVPVAGTYAVGYHHLATTNGTQFSIRVNGTNINSGAGAQTQVTLQASHSNFATHNLVDLAANDSITFVVNIGVLHGNPAYNRMYIYLLG